MKRTLVVALLAAGALATTAFAQSSAPENRGKDEGAAASDAKGGNAAIHASATAEANANANAEFERLKQGVESKGAKTSASARAKADARLDAAAKRVDDDAAKGDQRVAERLAAEFGMTADALIAEKNQLDVSWGQLMIAHALSANAKTTVTVQQLFDMRTSGMGWGQIAAGLGLKLGDVVSAVNTEGKVALGQAKADGKVPVIHGEGAKAGLGGGVNAGLGAGHAKVGAGIGAGVKVGH